MNYFELFDLQAAPRIDTSKLNRKLIALQRQFHPDFHIHLSAAEQQEAEEKAAMVNKAYKTLTHEQQLLQYYLIERGAIREDEKYELPTDFLMEMMELNETLESAPEGQMQVMVADAERSLENEVSSIFEKEAMEIEGSDLQKLKDYYYKKKYLKRILDRLPD